MKKSSVAIVCIATLAGCSLIELPFKLLGSILNGVFSLIQALLNVGSSAAMQAVKLTPLAMLFVQGPPQQETRLGSPMPLERLASAMENAPQEIFTLEEALAESRESEELGRARIVILDPRALLTETGRADAQARLGSSSILATRWIATSTLPAPAPEVWDPELPLSSRAAPSSPLQSD